MIPLAQAVPSANPTPPIVWQLQTNWPWAPWLTLLFVVVVVVGVAWLYARESSPASTPYRTLLASLRLVSIGLVLLMLSELLLSTTRSGLPRLVLLLDCSASMGLVDESPDNESNDDESNAGKSRLDQARELLLAKEGKLLDQWREKYVVEWITVADGVVRIPGDTPAESVERLGAVATQGVASGRSRLGDALTAALEERQGPPPAAIVLFSDGRTTAGRSLDEAREAARHRGVPIYAIGFGPTAAPPDARLTNLLADEIALVGDPVAVGVTVEANGMEGQTVQVTIRDVTADRVVAEQAVEITSATFSKPIQLLLRPEQKGKVTYRIEVEANGEERDRNNNWLDHGIDVRDDKVRVLLAAGYPNYEFRYLKHLLDRDSTFELTSYLQEADLDYAASDLAAISQLPLKEEDLDKWDVVVLIDLNPRLLPPRWWKNVHRHVVEQGGGLVLVAGPRYFPWHYGTTDEVAHLSPIDLQAAGPPGGRVDAGYRLQLTRLGQNAATLQLGRTPTESIELWRGLPAFYWFCEANQAKPAAQVLAVHPTARTSDGHPVPLAAIQYVGAGSVLYHGFDSSWRWRFRVGDVFFARYWGQSIRRLARLKIGAGDQRPEILVEREQFDVGEPVRLQLRTGINNPLVVGDVPAELLLETPGEPRRRLALTPSRISPHLWQATASHLPPGKYRATLAGPRLSEAHQAIDAPEAIEFEVVAPPGEFADRTMNESGLRSLAEGTYGKFYAIGDAQNFASDLPQGDHVPMEILPPIELWNGWWMLLAITGCLTTEWILRKRRAML